MAEKLRNRLIAFALLAGAGALLYRFGLTDEARDGIKSAIDSTKRAYSTIEGILGEARGVTMEESILPNRASTISQWEKMGY